RAVGAVGAHGDARSAAAQRRLAGRGGDGEGALTRTSGQAAVESAIVLPMVLFLILGTVQLFMVLQARVLAQYAVGRAVRMGALNFGSCAAMQRSAIAILMPAIAPGFAQKPTGGARGTAYSAVVTSRLNNRYIAGRDDGRDGPIVWMWRVSPLAGNIPA